MVAKLFTKPFGVAGDKTPIPNDTQVDGTVSYQTGFGADYERQLGVDPAAKNIGRQTFNELMFDATTALQEMQAGFGTSVYDLALAQALPGGGYPKGACIPRVDGLGLWLNLTVNNATNPDTGGAGWKAFNPQGGSSYGVDTGVANAYSVVFTPALTARTEETFLCVKIKTANTGPSTINDGLGTVPIVGEAQQALQGGEFAANGVAWFQWNTTLVSYVLVFSSGGSKQVLDATKSLHAVNAGQIQGQKVTAFTTAGSASAYTLSPIPAIPAYAASQGFQVTFHATGTATPTINISGRGPVNLMQYNAAGTKIPAIIIANQVSQVIFDGVDAVLLDPLPIVTANLVGVAGAALNLKLSSTGLNSVVLVTADEIIVESASGQYQTLRSVSVSPSFATAGVNGLDVGAANSQTISTWYDVWVIWNGSTTAGLLSLSSSVPTMPAGYTHRAFVTQVRTDANPSNKFPLSFYQVDKDVSYKVASGSNVPTLPGLTSGVVGVYGTSLASVGISAVVPPKATKVRVSCGSSTTTTVGVLVAPNGSYSAALGATSTPPLGTSGSNALQVFSGEIILEGPNLFIAAQNQTYSCIVGWSY